MPKVILRALNVKRGKQRGLKWKDSGGFESGRGHVTRNIGVAVGARV